MTEPTTAARGRTVAEQQAGESIPTWIADAGSSLAKLPALDRAAALRTLETVAVAQADDANVAEPPPVRDLKTYLEHEIELPPMLVAPGQLARGAVTALISRAGKGKTTMSLNRILRWSVGEPMFADLSDVMVPCQPLRTLIIENEGAPGFFQEKLQQMVDNQGWGAEKRETAGANVYVWGEGGWPRLKLDDPKVLDQVKRGIEKIEPDVVFMEPFRSLWGGEENSATEMAALVDAIIDLAARYKVGVLLTHHERKAGPGEDGEQMSAGRGSTVLSDAAAVMERWTHVREETSELAWVKWRFAKPSAPVRMRFDWQKWGYDYVSEDSGKREIQQLLMDDPERAWTVGEIAAELDESPKRTRRLTAELQSEVDEVHEYRSLTSPGSGSTGKRYRYVMTGENEGGIDY